MKAAGDRMKDGKTDVWQGTLALMVLTTLEALGPQHGFGVARRIEQTSGDRLSVNPGTLYPALLKLEQEGFGKRPPRTLLPVDPRRPETARARDPSMADYQRHHRPISRRREGAMKRTAGGAPQARRRPWSDAPRHRDHRGIAFAPRDAG